MDGAGLRPLEAPPRLGADDACPRRRRERRAAANRRPRRADLPLPLAGLACSTPPPGGPALRPGMLAALGRRDPPRITHAPDGIAHGGGAFVERPGWWEHSALFLGANANKRGLTLDLADARGRELVKRLLARCDVFVENFSPRVVESFGLDWESVRALNPRLVMVRMPAFGLDDRAQPVGFAKPMEQIRG